MAHGEIYVQLAVTFADDPKVRALARYGKDARRIRDLYVQMLCYCKAGLTDGLVPDDQIGVLVYPDSPAIGRKDVLRLAEVGLIEAREGAWFVRGFLKRNKSRSAVQDKSAAKAAASVKANHMRWHVDRGEPKADCELCRQASDLLPTNASDHFVRGNETVSGTNTKPLESFGDSSDDMKNEMGSTHPNGGRAQSSQLGSLESSRIGSHNGSQPDPTTDPPSDQSGIHRDIGHRSEDIGHRSETQKGSESSSSTPSAPGPAASEPAPPLPPEPQPDEDESLDRINSKIEGRIIELLAELTGRTVDRVHASTVRRQLLDDRPVTNPLGYVASCIRGEPKRYLPTNGAPWESPVPPLPPKDPDAYDHGAAQARALLAEKLRK